MPRADKAYVRSLLDLYTSPAPGSTCAFNLLPKIPKAKFGLKMIKRPSPLQHSGAGPPIAPQGWIWKVPPGALSNAGRLVVLRGRQSNNSGSASVDEDDVTAEITTDGELREVVFG